MAWFRGLCRLDVHHSIRSVCLGDAQISHVFAGHVPLQKRLEHRPQTAPCVSGWHHARSGSVKIRQAPVNLLQDTLHGQIWVRTDSVCAHISLSWQATSLLVWFLTSSRTWQKISTAWQNTSVSPCSRLLTPLRSCSRKVQAESALMSIDWTIRPKLFDPIRPYLTPKDILTEAMMLDFDRSSTFKEKHKCLLLCCFFKGGETCN